MLDKDKVLDLLKAARPGTSYWSGATGIAWSEMHYGNVDFTTHGVHFEDVESVGGEGQGDHAHVVLKTTDSEGNVQYWKQTGFYSSYDGTEWDGEFSEVVPTQKTVTVYE